MWNCVCVYDSMSVSVCEAVSLCVCDSISVCMYGGGSVWEIVCKWVRLILSVCLCDCICEHLLMSVCHFVCVNVPVGFRMNMYVCVCVCVCVCVWMCRRGGIVQSFKLKCWNKVLISWDHLCLRFRISANYKWLRNFAWPSNTLYVHQRAPVYLSQKKL